MKDRSSYNFALPRVLLTQTLSASRNGEPDHGGGEGKGSQDNRKTRCGLWGKEGESKGVKKQEGIAWDAFSFKHGYNSNGSAGS